MRLVLVRHGATMDVYGQHTGLTDIPLTPDGIAQAERAARLVRILMGDNFESATLYSSPLGRAVVTAGVIFGEDRQPVLTDDLLEFDYGDYEGLTPAEVRALKPGWDIWRDGCPNGETCQQVGDHVDRFLDRIDADETTIAVAHGHVIRILAARAVGLAPEQGRIFTLDTATVSVIEDVPGKRVVKVWNLDPGLVAE